MRIKESAKEFGKTKSLVAMAMLLALRLALGYVTNIQLTENIKIGFTIFPTTVACMMFGPVPGLVMGGAADLIGFFLKPTGAFFPGYTLDSMVAGFLYGCFFYRREKISLWRVMAALAAVTIIVNLCMTTSWRAIQISLTDFGMFFRDGAEAWRKYITTFGTIIGERALKNLIMYPINVIGVYFFLTAVREIPILRPMINEGKIIRPSLPWKKKTENIDEHTVKYSGVNEEA
ncbi:MAG: folate family ECF transporter S component [Lachnospiraceae bacterium]|nr:folate family ECF transporter S component [Lachnospiraceae bacterium]